MHRIIVLAMLVSLTYPFGPSAMSATKVSIQEACAACTAAGNKPAKEPVQSTLKKETSLIGTAYLNYIYQNDLSNSHFCEAMLLMNSQIPAGTANPYVHLFDAGRGEKMRTVLQDVQLSFDYSIARSSPPENKLKASIKNIKDALKK